MSIPDIQRDSVEIQKDAGEIQRDAVEIQRGATRRLDRVVNPLGYNGVVRAIVGERALFEEDDDDAHILKSSN